MKYETGILLLIHYVFIMVIELKNMTHLNEQSLNITNASKYNITIYSSSGQLVHQSYGSASSSPVCVWNTTGVASAIYYATVTFENDCQEISNTYQLLVGACKKSADDYSETEEEQRQEKYLSSHTDITRLDFDFTIFPNPNDGSFSVKVPNNKITTPYSLEIINTAGKIIYKVEHLNTNQLIINQTGLPKGAYFIRIKSVNRVSTQKLIIQ